MDTLELTKGKQGEKGRYSPELNIDPNDHPIIIQGGMGAAVSGWELANSVARLGQMGVVSGTALDLILARRLQAGDPGGHMRRAMANFPVREIADRIIEKYYIPGGKKDNEPFRPVPMFSAKPSQFLLELTVVANFVEVYLAKEGHKGLVGINYLEKIQLPNVPSIYGAMLAGVDYVLMGAGIPREIPGVLDKLSEHEDASIFLNVLEATRDDNFKMDFSPVSVMGKTLPKLTRPKFLAIIASEVLAVTLAKKSTGKVDGFIIEGPIAGGHNAMPRGPLTVNEKGEPIYGPKDEVDVAKIKALGLPFWLAGSYGEYSKLKEALDMGASGVQVGTAFAFCRESGLTNEIKEKIIAKALKGEAEVFTDPKASPTGFPFKVVRLEGTNSEDNVYKARLRVCDLGYLRHLYRKEDGTVGYRCPSEPVDAYVNKSGAEEDTAGRKCLCNGLMANIGLPQHWKSGYVEKPLVTAGYDLKNITRFLKQGETTYTAEDVINNILEGYVQKGSSMNL